MRGGKSPCLGHRGLGLAVDTQQRLECRRCACCLPCDAPVWVNALDGGVFYVLKGEALPDLGVVHSHTDLDRADPRQGGGGVAHDLRHGPSAGLVSSQLNLDV